MGSKPIERTKMSVAAFLKSCAQSPTKSASPSSPSPSPKVTPSSGGGYATVDRGTSFDGLDSKRKRKRGELTPFASFVDFATGVKDVVFSPGTGMVLCYAGAGASLWASGISYSLMFGLGTWTVGGLGVALTIPVGLPIAAVVQLVQMAARMHAYNPDMASNISIAIGTKPIILASESNSNDALLPEVNKAAKNARKKAAAFVAAIGYILYAIELFGALTTTNVLVRGALSLPALSRVFVGVFGVEVCLVLSKILGVGHLSAKQQRAKRAKRTQAEAEALQNLQVH